MIKEYFLRKPIVSHLSAIIGAAIFGFGAISMGIVGVLYKAHYTPFTLGLNNDLISRATINCCTAVIVYLILCFLFIWQIVLNLRSSRSLSRMMGSKPPSSVLISPSQISLHELSATTTATNLASPTYTTLNSHLNSYSVSDIGIVAGGKREGAINSGDHLNDPNEITVRSITSFRRPNGSSASIWSEMSQQQQQERSFKPSFSLLENVQNGSKNDHQSYNDNPWYNKQT